MYKSYNNDIRKSPAFETSDQRLHEIWVELQKVQVEFSLGQELMAYYTSPHWAHAKTVVELGAGTGYHLGRLAERFPDKSYRGIDISPELTAYAQLHEPQVDQFECADVYELTGRYDFCVMRLFLQHLPETDRVLAKVAQITHPGGAALVIDSDDTQRLYDPPLPQFMRFFSDYTSRETGKGRRRDVENSVLASVKTSKDWRIAKAEKFVIPSTLGDNLHLLRQTYTLFLEMLEVSGQMPSVDFASVKDEWQHWCGLEKAYTQVGLTALLLERV